MEFPLDDKAKVIQIYNAISINIDVSKAMR